MTGSFGGSGCESQLPEANGEIQSLSMSYGLDDEP